MSWLLHMFPMKVLPDAVPKPQELSPGVRGVGKSMCPVTLSPVSSPIP